MGTATRTVTVIQTATRTATAVAMATLSVFAVGVLTMGAFGSRASVQVLRLAVLALSPMALTAATWTAYCALAGRPPDAPGTGATPPTEAVPLPRGAMGAGADACLLVTPYYNKPTQEGLYRHFKTIADSTSLPCIMYNVPSRTVRSLSVDTIVRLSEIDNIIGVKEASADMQQVSHTINRTRDDFYIWSGNDTDKIGRAHV